MAHSANKGGVIADTDNELTVSGTASPVAVASGAAVVYGIPYFNTASVNVAIATPASLTRVDYIVLRADWTAQTVRITRIAGTEGAGAPSLTQTPSTTWDIPLATVSITTGGVITVTDAREWLYVTGPDTVTASMLADDAVVAGKLADDAVVAGNLADDAVVAGNVAAQAVDPSTDLNGTNGVVANPASGNARGADAVDLSTDRGSVGASAVASGTGSTIAGGQDNTASGTNSTVGGGRRNIASATYSFVPGGQYAKADKIGQMSHAAASFSSSSGTAQTSVLVAATSTTNATPKAVGIGPGNADITIPSDTTWAFSILLVARRSDADNESAAYKFEGCIDNNAGTTALVGTVTKTVLAEDTAAWDADVTASDASDALVITATGEAAKTIYWVARVELAEVTG